MIYYKTEERAREVLRIMSMRAAYGELELSGRLDVHFDREKGYYIGAKRSRASSEGRTVEGRAGQRHVRSDSTNASRSGPDQGSLQFDNDEDEEQSLLKLRQVGSGDRGKPHISKRGHE